MGEIAEMILEGVFCQKCGVAIGDGVGFPRDCADCRREKNRQRGIAGPSPLGKQLRRRLELLAECARVASDAPMQYARLARMGYCVVTTDRGSEHAEVASITEAGRAYLTKAAQPSPRTQASSAAQSPAESERHTNPTKTSLRGGGVAGEPRGGEPQ